MMPSSHWLQLSYVCGSYDKVFLLGALNDSDRVEERELLIATGSIREPTA